MSDKGQKSKGERFDEELAKAHQKLFPLKRRIAHMGSSSYDNNMPNECFLNSDQDLVKDVGDILGVNNVVLDKLQPRFKKRHAQTVKRLKNFPLLQKSQKHLKYIKHNVHSASKQRAHVSSLNAYKSYVQRTEFGKAKNVEKDNHSKNVEEKIHHGIAENVKNRRYKSLKDMTIHLGIAENVKNRRSKSFNADNLSKEKDCEEENNPKLKIDTRPIVRNQSKSLSITKKPRHFGEERFVNELNSRHIYEDFVKETISKSADISTVKSKSLSKRKAVKLDNQNLNEKKKHKHKHKSKPKELPSLLEKEKQNLPCSVIIEQCPEISYMLGLKHMSINLKYFKEIVNHSPQSTSHDIVRDLSNTDNESLPTEIAQHLHDTENPDLVENIDVESNDDSSNDGDTESISKDTSHSLHIENHNIEEIFDIDSNENSTDDILGEQDNSYDSSDDEIIVLAHPSNAKLNLKISKIYSASEWESKKIKTEENCDADTNIEENATVNSSMHEIIDLSDDEEELQILSSVNSEVEKPAHEIQSNRVNEPLCSSSTCPNRSEPETSTSDSEVEILKVNVVASNVNDDKRENVMTSTAQTKKNKSFCKSSEKALCENEVTSCTSKATELTSDLNASDSTSLTSAQMSKCKSTKNESILSSNQPLNHENETLYDKIEDEMDYVAASNVLDLENFSKQSISPLIDLFEKECKDLQDIQYAEKNYSNVAAGLRMLKMKKMKKLKYIKYALNKLEESNQSLVDKKNKFCVGNFQDRYPKDAELNKLSGVNLGDLCNRITNDTDLLDKLLPEGQCNSTVETNKLTKDFLSSSFVNHNDIQPQKQLTHVEKSNKYLLSNQSLKIKTEHEEPKSGKNADNSCSSSSQYQIFNHDVGVCSKSDCNPYSTFSAHTDSVQREEYSYSLTEKEKSVLAKVNYINPLTVPAQHVENNSTTNAEIGNKNSQFCVAFKEPPPYGSFNYSISQSQNSAPSVLSGSSCFDSHSKELSTNAASFKRTSVMPAVTQIQKPATVSASSLHKWPNMGISQRATSQDLHKVPNALGRFCEVCGKTAVFACQGCSKVYFCSNSCGVSYWNSGHFAVC